MTEAISKAERAMNYFTGFMSRSGSHPCDRSEAGRQMARYRQEIESLETTLKVLNDDK